MVGIDEVGRGCLAGPLLVVAARQKAELPVVFDSKILTRAQRENLFTQLVRVCEVGEGWVNSAEIDEKGLAAAMRLGVARALKALSAPAVEEIIMDGPVNYLPKKYKNIACIIGADATVPIVSAASVIAKVKRDNFMARLKDLYPNYGFEKHVGYGTMVHMDAIKKYGSIKNIHRMSFKPLNLPEEASI